LKSNFLTKHIKLLFVQPQIQPQFNQTYINTKPTSTKSTFYKTTFFKPQPQKLSQYQTLYLGDHDRLLEIVFNLQI